MVGITSLRSFILLSMCFSFIFLSNQGAITFVSSCNEPEAAPAPSPEACDNPEGCNEPETGPPPPLGPPPPPPPCEWDETCGDPWPEVRLEGDGCDLIVESGVCDNWGCGYFTCEDNCKVGFFTREQGCVWDEWRKKPRCICR
ncbi:hypothetical protein C5167_026762 [Papaver somniferum]|uniref:chitin-binding lectin 1-like n=1 Tax=Papaver somniferum TaxID=3469 RepID=UPI000E6FE9F0|nr:chitin-binding lectin 1-like [Papaver somniferum]RZC86088.1 hypothetical protein C5167_026762 [Papaver somniferum]